MKNKIKLLGIIAVVAIIGFSMAGCTEPGSNTYTVYIYDNSDAEINSAFGAGTVPIGDGWSQKILTGNRNTLLTATESAYAGGVNKSKQTGKSLSEIETMINGTLTGNSSHFNAVEKTAIINELKSKNYVVSIGEGEGCGVIGIFKE